MVEVPQCKIELPSSGPSLGGGWGVFLGMQHPVGKNFIVKARSIYYKGVLKFSDLSENKV